MTKKTGEPNFYNKIQKFWEDSFPNYGEVLNKKADALPDGQEHTVAYYENLVVDPISELSDDDKAQAEAWMKASENLSKDEDLNNLSESDLSEMKKWMKASKKLPLELETTVGMLDSLVSAWDTFCGNKYMRDLNALERSLAARKPARKES